MTSSIVERVCRDAGVPDLVDRLVDQIPASDLQSLLLEVARRRSAKRSPADLMAQYSRDATVQPGGVDGRRLAKLVVAAFDSAPGYAAVQLAPVEPAGVNLVLAGISQNNVLATVRSTEVVADPTSGLALEAAQQRRAGVPIVRLCACQRALRLQPFERPLAQHFALFALVAAARSDPDHASEIGALREHVEAYLRLASAASSLGTPLEELVVRISDTEVHRSLMEQGVVPRADVQHPSDAMTAEQAAKLGRRLGRLERACESLAALLREIPDCRIVVDLTRTHAVGYYDGLQLRIDAKIAGEERNLADGGSVNWTARLLSDQRERLFTSGIGLERLVPAT